MNETILIIGASGQIGSELTAKLREIHGSNKVIASDIREGSAELINSGPFEILDATDQEAIEAVVDKYQVGTVYLMAAMLSATAEKAPMKAWELNMNSLFIILNLAKEKRFIKYFGLLVLLYLDLLRLLTKLLKLPLWNLPQYMVSANKQENVGANTIILDMGWTYAVFAIRA